MGNDKWSDEVEVCGDMSNHTITLSIDGLIDRIMIDELGYRPGIGDKEYYTPEIVSEIRKEIRYNFENAMEDKVVVQRIAKRISKRFGI